MNLNQRRIMSLNLMRDLQPLIQAGVVSAEEGQRAVANWKAGNEELLKAILLSPKAPVYMTPALNRLEAFISQH